MMHHSKQICLSYIIGMIVAIMVSCLQRGTSSISSIFACLLQAYTCTVKRPRRYASRHAASHVYFCSRNAGVFLLFMPARCAMDTIVGNFFEASTHELVFQGGPQW